MNTLIRVTTVPVSLEKLLEGQLTFMQKEYKVLAVSSDRERLTTFGNEVKVETFAVDMTREITPGKDLKAVWELYRLFKKEKPLIVHTHTPKAGIAGMMAAKMAGVPLRLHTVAGLPLLETRGVRRKVLEAVEKITFACATNVYPNSARIYDYLLENGFISKDKLKVIGKGSSNGIDTEYFNPVHFSREERSQLRRSLKIPQNDVVFIFIGRLVRDKGINELVEAFEELSKTNKEITLLLVGPFEADLDPLEQRTIEKMEENPKIIETGFQKDVRPFLACADILAFPSYREGFPNVVMQAGAMELPSIVTNINGCNEIIREGESGVFVPVKEVRALSLAMKEMIKDESKRRLMGKNSRRIIKENFERHEVWNALLTEYKRLETELTNKTR